MTTPTTMQERFDEKFIDKHLGDSGIGGNDPQEPVYQLNIDQTDIEDIKLLKSFIQSEIDLAVEKREKEVFEWAKIKVDSFFKELLNNK